MKQNEKQNQKLNLKQKQNSAEASRGFFGGRVDDNKRL